MSTSLAVLVVLASLVCVCLAEQSANKDFAFFQDYSHRYNYASAVAPVIDLSAQSSQAWETLPFTVSTQNALKKGGVLSGLGLNKNCLLTLNEGAFYSASTKEHEPSMQSMENPYSAWSSAGDTGLGDSLINIMLYSEQLSNATSYTLYGATKQNIAIMSFAVSKDAPCGKLSSVSYLLEEDVKLGHVNSLQFSPSLNSIFVGSLCTGVTRISLGTDAATAPVPATLMQTGKTSSTALWVEQWQTLYTADDVAFYTVDYSQNREVPKVAHEWIGGVLAFTPTDLDFDDVNGFLWIAEKESLHRLTRDKVYWRYGYQQGAPMQNISSVAVHNGIVYAGSENLGLSSVDGAASPDQLDATIGGNGDASPDPTDGAPPAGAHGDPWRWSYYFGPRYLPSNAVLSLHVDRSRKSGHSLLVFTETGAAYLDVRPFSLKEKAAAMDTFQYPRHDRYGLSTPVDLNAFGDLSTYHFADGDNDGLWTGMSAMSMTYRVMLSKGQDKDAIKQAWRAFEGLEMLSVVTGGHPNYVARSFCKISDGDNGCPTSIDPNCTEDCWYNTHTPEFEGWYYKGDTSSDELCGHMAAYPMLYDHVAQTEGEKKRVLDMIEGITMGIIDNDLYFISPETGERTTWGFWNPKELNGMPEHYSERGTNSLEILAWTASAYSITGNQKYKDTFWTLVNDHDYVANCLNVKIDSAIDENHSDTELLMLAFHSLYYAYQRLPDGHERKHELKEMVSLMDPAIQRSWRLMRGELNGLWLGIYKGVAQQTKYVSNSDVEKSLWTLRRWQLDNINWPIHNSQRIDLDISTSFFTRNSDSNPIMRHIRPPTERSSSEYNNDPFTVDPGAGEAGNCEYEPAVWMFPYYIMAYHGMVEA